ncbi:hypothetical protein CRUP_002356 [Coryphaenoides rupestris]|nr:hypothetical protein CRUP_002356 [Coryphaenoides rupestris]
MNIGKQASSWPRGRKWKEEVEEMKATLSSAEEGRARASAHSKNMEKENRSLIAKITSLQIQHRR